MIDIPGFSNLTPLREARHSLLFRARSNDSGQSVLLKTLLEDIPNADQLGRFELEYRIMRCLDSPHIIKVLDYIASANRRAMIFEDIHGDWLSSILAEGAFGLEDFLTIAIDITEGLARVHAENVIHKDINPSNIIWNRETGDVRIADFSLGTQLSVENPVIVSPGRLEGTLPYISPEQTGRMNRPIDYRTDLYSLGVTFFEMLTGRRPFSADTPVELVHSHIAREPPSPKDFVRDLPDPVCDIVLKLMSKMAEDRYQSCDGLKHDLEECLRLHPEIHSLPIAARDFLSQFIIPEKLYGRESEVSQLLQAFNETSAGATRLVRVTGYSGIGKSTLVQEVHRPIVDRQGYFISGKFDQFSRNLPYACLVQAFRDLIRQILSEPEENIARWKEAIQTAVEPNGALVTAVVPELEIIIGKQPAVEELSPGEQQIRFILVFQKFIQVFASREHPLTLVLDDMQWADLPSLKLIEALATNPDSGHLLTIFLYRDNEVDDAHPLMLFLRDLERGKSILTLNLGPLGKDDIVQMLSETFHRSAEECLDLADLSLERTGGNPFFLKQYFTRLYEEELIRFEPGAGRWLWDLEGIRSSGFTDNVVDLMVEKIHRLPENTQEVLRFASMIGSQFSLGFLARSLGRTPSETALALLKALRERLVTVRSENLRQAEWGSSLTADGSVAEPSLPIEVDYAFQHDRIQQAAYSLNPEEDRPELHLKLGRALIDYVGEDGLEEHLFEITRHLNLGRVGIHDRAEQDRLFLLNLRAGNRARASSAFDVARMHLEIAMEGRDERAWTEDYERIFTCYLERSECEFLCGNYELADRLFAILREKSRDKLDRARVARIMVAVYTNLGRFDEAIDTGLKSLSALGIRLKLEPTGLDLVSQVVALNLRKGRRSAPDLLDLPPMKDPLILETMDILTELCAAVYQKDNKKLFILCLLVMVNLTLKHGNTSASALAYVGYGLVLGSAFGRFRSGQSFGEMALKCLERYPSASIEAKTKFFFACFVNHWCNPIKTGHAYHKDAYSAGVNAGDLTYSGWAILVYSNYAAYEGQSPARVYEELESYLEFLRWSGNDLRLTAARVQLQTQRCLMGKTASPTSYDEGDFTERQVLEEFEAADFGQGISLYAVNKMRTCMIHQQIEEAEAMANLADRALDSLMATQYIVDKEFLHCLIFIHKMRGQHGPRRWWTWLRFRKRLFQLRTWRRKCPANITHKLRLVEAEWAGLRGRHARAERLFLEARKAATTNECPPDAAFIAERTGRYYETLGMGRLAEAFLRDAFQLYSSLGMQGRSRLLDNRQAGVRKSHQDTHDTLGAPAGTTDNGASWPDDGGPVDQIDLQTVIRSSQAISDEIVFEDLIGTMLRTVAENAGARRVVYVLKQKDDLTLEAEYRTEDDWLSIPGSVSLNGLADQLPVSIIQFVSRTKENVILENAGDENSSVDAYVNASRIKSLLCIPLLNQGELNGVLYLENDLTMGAFTQDRVEVLKLLSSQIAISIKNARLYDSLKKINLAYERFVPREFLRFLNKESITEVLLGDQVEVEMSILFSDIRDFTTLSEQMTPQENFDFINAFLSRMEPVIRKYDGFIDKYIGDAIMALFAGSADDALSSAIEMFRQLNGFNQERVAEGREPVRIGIGLNTGRLMLGTVGGEARMDGTVISDAVNLASRLEGLTLQYQTPLLISDRTYRKLQNPGRYHFREIDAVIVKGKTTPVVVHEVFDINPPEVVESKLATRPNFSRGLARYRNRAFAEALREFETCLEEYPDDQVARLYRERCQSFLENPPPEDFHAPSLS